MSLFNQTMEIKGKYAELVRTLASEKYLNCRNVDILLMGIAVGISKKLKADPDTSTKTEPAKIDVEQIFKNRDDIEYFYKLLMLTDSKYCSSPKERCNKAFRYIETDKGINDELYFMKVLFGGIEFLHEQIVENTSNKNDIFNNIIDFVETEQWKTF